MLIRLRRADIACNQISAFFPQSSVPNAAACWLRLQENVAIKVGREIFTAAGRVLGLLKPVSSKSSTTDVEDLLCSAGLDAMSAHRLEAKMDQGHILIAVTARNEDEASVAWHIFKHAGAETIVVAGESEPAGGQRDFSVVATAWAAAA